MSLAAPYQEHYYVADGSTTSFAFGQSFTTLNEIDVKCIVYFEDGTNCVPVFNVNMTTGFINIVSLTKPDGTLLTVPPAGSIVRVFRKTPEAQNVTASQLQNYTAKQLERVFDSLVAMIQEVSYSDIHKTVRLTETQRDIAIDYLPDNKDQAVIYWDVEERKLMPAGFGQNQVVKSDGVEWLVYNQSEGKVYFIPRQGGNPIPIGEATIHNDLSGRNAPDCHPESAITGLREHLQELRDKDIEIEEDVQTALNRSQEAKETADEAKETAEYAQTIAGQAKDIAEDAKETAEGIEDIAQEALDKVTQEITDREDADDALQNQITDNKDAIEDHIANTNNPHSVTKAQVGLSNVDNTSDLDKPISTATQSALDLKMPISTKYGASISLTIDSSTYVVTAQLKDQDNNNLGTAQTIDLPLESVVVSGSYDSDTKEVVLTLQGGSTIRFSVADLVSGLQSEITAQNPLDADLVNDSTSAHKFVTATEKTNWNNHIGNTSNPHEVTKAQVGLGNVDNTSDLNKPISTATQTALNAKQDTLTEGTGISIDENNVISATFSESYFRGKFSTWDTVPTDYRNYYPDYTGSTKPTRTDYMVVEDPSAYVKPGMPIQIYNEPMTGGTALVRFVFGATDITLNHDQVSQRGAEGIIIGTAGNQLRITYASEVWKVTPLDVPVIVDGVTKPINEIALQWHYQNPSQETLYKGISFAGTGGYLGTWRFSYQSDNWDATGKNGWYPEYQIEDVLPIATDTVAGITKLYTTAGSNTDGSMTQKSVTDALSAKANIADLAPVAISGSYNDLSNKPIIPGPQVNSDWNATTGPAEILNKPSLATVATSGSYNDLSDKPTIGNATLTIQKNSTTIDTFTANATSNKTIDIAVPTKTSDITNDSDYQNSTQVATAISTHNTSTTAHSNQFNAITDKIPAEASSSNKLADKAFVNSSIATNTANFIGTFNSVAELEAYSGTVTNNDYAFVIVTDSAGNTAYDRYKYTTATTPASWVFEYELNNSSFTAAQWAAINSGANTTNIGQIATNTTTISNHIGNTSNPHQVTKAQVGLGNVDNTSDLAKPISTATQTALNAKANIADLAPVAISGSYNDLSNKPIIPGPQVNSDWNATTGPAEILNKPSLATVATTGAYSDLSGTPSLATVATSGDYADLTNKPTIPAAQVNSDWNAASGVAQILNKPTLGTMAAESASDYTKTSGLATVATTGNYNDLSNKPTIPAAQVNSDWSATSGVAQILNKPTLATVATSGSYNDLSNKPTIPTVNNSTITITQGGVTKGSFTLNQATGDTIALDAGGGSSVDIDNLTITKNSSDEIQAVATVNANTAAGATNPIYDWVGSLAEYTSQAVATNHPDWVCYVTDDVSGGATVYTKTQVDTGFVAKGHEIIEFQAPTAENNYTWYRKYADGWVEQGGSSGYGTINLPVTMADDNYTATIANKNGNWEQIMIRNKTITSFQAVCAKDAVFLYCDWQVSGIAA